MALRQTPSAPVSPTRLCGARSDRNRTSRKHTRRGRLDSPKTSCRSSSFSAPPPAAYLRARCLTGKFICQRNNRMILLIDNYDSFTYNLYQYLCELGADVEVVRNDQATVED